MIEVALCLVLCLVVGVTLDRCLFGRVAADLVEAGGRGLALGMGAVGTLSLLVDGLGLSVTMTSVLVGCGVLMALCLVLRRMSGPLAPARPELPESSSRERVLAHGLLLFALVGVGYAVYSGFMRPTYQFDALARWMFKTKALAFDQTLVRSPVSTEAWYGYTHQRYPPLVAYVANLPSLVTGRFDDRIASAMYPWYSVALVGVVWGVLRRRTTLLAAGVGAAWVAHLPLLSFVIGPPPGAGASSALADLPLALFFTTAGVAALDALEGVRDRAHLETGLLLLFATLTKNEGLPFTAAVVLGLLLFASRARWRRAGGVALVAVGGYALLWGRIAVTLPNLDEDYVGQVGLEALMAGWQRLGLILPALGRQVIDWPSWNATWPALALLLALGWRSLGRPAMRLLVVVLLIQLASYVYAYMITAWSSPSAEAIIEYEGESDPLFFLLTLTLGRLLMHIAPLAILLGLLVSPPRLRGAG